MPLVFDADAGEPPVDSILHPTDLSEASERAFHHALAITVRRAAQLTLLHAVGRRSTDNWADFPSVRSKLAEWRSAGSTAELEERIGRSNIKKIQVDIPDPVAACLDHLDRAKVDMLVLATESRRGLSRLIRASHAEALARRSGLFTLFVPSGARGFIGADTGEVSVRRVLLPVNPSTDPRPAMLRAARFAELFDDPSVEITLLHVAEGEEVRLAELPELPYCSWSAIQRPGDVVKQILSVAEETEADAIFMSSDWQATGRGKRGGGKVTERVLEAVPCPLAVVPVGGRA